MHTERFNKLRKDILENIFKKEDIVKVWRKIVRKQLRSLDIKDLYDHYDYNYNIEEHAKFIRNEVVRGEYKVSKPFIYRLEKKFGICRHIIIPHPTDALVLQVLVESVSKEILSKQPSTNVFYSRDKHKNRLPHEEWNDSWLTLTENWVALQKKIYKFNDENELLIVTDLANFYDSIDTVELQKIILGYIDNNEVLIDLLFRIIAEISWRPDYLPHNNKGLPTVNLEAIRLLAHALLFEIDEILKIKSNDNFTRWMDDIVVGVDCKKNAVTIISTLSDMLKSRGLALNLIKTNIYTSEEAKYHFQIEQNLYLDDIVILENSDEDYNKVTTELKKKFKQHLKDQRPKNWDKITKRYITIFIKFKSPKLLTEVVDLYVSHPSLRPQILNYLINLGFKKRTSEVLMNIFKNIDIFDDISLFQICQLVTSWEIPLNETSKKFLKEFEGKLENYLSDVKVSDFYSILWFKVKYNHPEDLLKFINKYENYWMADAFLRRQVVAACARLLKHDETKIKKWLAIQVASGVPSVVTLANQILKFEKIKKVEFGVQSYLFHKPLKHPYPFHKFLVLCSLLNSANVREDDKIKKKILEHIKDPYYLKWLDQQYNIS
jgi:hypothetical protein